MCVPPRTLLLSLAYYPVAVILACLLVFHSAGHSRAFDDAARLSTISSKATALGQSVVETVTFGFYDSGLPDEQDYGAAAALAAYHSSCVTWLAWSLLGSTLAFGALLVIEARLEHRSSCVVYVQHMVCIALICFCIGICSIALSFRATTQLPVLGEVVLRHQSKGILATTLKLLESGDWVLGLILLVFSVLLPVAKVAAILFACNAEGPRRHAAIRFVKAIGKWSMLDVFVVAVLVSVLTMGRDSGTEASVGPGVVFFAAYCLMTMLATAWLVRITDRWDGIAMTRGNTDIGRPTGPLPDSKHHQSRGKPEDDPRKGPASASPCSACHGDSRPT